MKDLVRAVIVFLTIVSISCSKHTQSIIDHNTNQSMSKKTIMEVTTFNVKSKVNPLEFNQRDATIESDFTMMQTGFIKRWSGTDQDGQYVVIVFWESADDAAASMQKFMTDPSVSDYAEMIDAGSMRMERYAMDRSFTAGESEFVEVMSYDITAAVDIAEFDQINKKVEVDFTAKRDGFLQRMTGANEKGEQVVAVFWTNKERSDAALEPFMEASIAKDFMSMMDQSSIRMGRYQFLNSINNYNMQLSKKDQVLALLNSFNNGDQTPISYINPDKYIQHNLSVGDGLQGFGEVMQHAPPQGFKANVIRAFEDGDYVFTHTEYDFFGPKAGFDIFRFEDGRIVEHWDNLIEVQPANPSGRTQFDGTQSITDLDKTEANKEIVKGFITDVLLNHENDKITSYINANNYLQHNPAVADGLDGFGAAMQYFAENGLVMEYDQLHMVLGQGNFVLTVSEGKFGKGEHTAFYDLFRLENNQIVEHWDVISTIPPKSEWKNDNGKF